MTDHKVRSVWFYVLIGGVIYLAGVLTPWLVLSPLFYSQTRGVVTVNSDAYIKFHRFANLMNIELRGDDPVKYEENEKKSGESYLMPPLVRVGDLLVQYEKKTGNYCISLDNENFPIASRHVLEQGITQERVCSKTLSGEPLSRVCCRFAYGKDGTPSSYIYSTTNADATLNRIYHDNNADGQLDTVAVIKDDKVIYYRIDESVLEKISERDFPKEKHPASKWTADTPVAK